MWGGCARQGTTFPAPSVALWAHSPARSTVSPGGPRNTKMGASSPQGIPWEPPQARKALPRKTVRDPKDPQKSTHSAFVINQRGLRLPTPDCSNDQPSLVKSRFATHMGGPVDILEGSCGLVGDFLKSLAGLRGTWLGSRLTHNGRLRKRLVGAACTHAADLCQPKTGAPT